MSNSEKNTAGELTIKKSKFYDPSKSMTYNMVQMPKCVSCKKRYGSPAWNDDDSYAKNEIPKNQPIQCIRLGMKMYMCPSCSEKSCRKANL